MLLPPVLLSANQSYEMKNEKKVLMVGLGFVVIFLLILHSSIRYVWRQREGEGEGVIEGEMHGWRWRVRGTENKEELLRSDKSMANIEGE